MLLSDMFTAVTPISAGGYRKVDVSYSNLFCTELHASKITNERYCPMTKYIFTKIVLRRHHK